MNGNFYSSHFNTEIDLSFGMDLFLSESILLTLQLTPQFNYWIVNQNSIYINDLNGEFENYGNNYADFKLGYFDLLLIYKFQLYNSTDINGAAFKISNEAYFI